MTPTKTDRKTAGRPVAVISGATDGIGLELAKRYRDHGYQLVLIGRREVGELDPALFDADNYCRTDLALHSAATEIQQFLTAHDIAGIDLLIHNAATGWYGDIAQQSQGSIRELVATNLRFPIAATHALSGHLERVHGTVAFISSIAACLPCPKYAVYAATKAGIEAFARACVLNGRAGSTLSSCDWERSNRIYTLKRG